MPDAKCVAKKVCIPAPRLRNSRTLTPLHALLRQHARVVTLAVFWVLKMRIYTEALISQKHLTLTPINHSYETSKKSCRTLQSCYSLNIYSTWTQVIYKYFWELLCHCPFPCLIFELEWSMGLWALSVIPISYRRNKQEEVRKINAFCNSIGERSGMMLVWGYSGSTSACWARRSKMSLVWEQRNESICLWLLLW